MRNRLLQLPLGRTVESCDEGKTAQKETAKKEVAKATAFLSLGIGALEGVRGRERERERERERGFGPCARGRAGERALPSISCCHYCRGFLVSRKLLPGLGLITSRPAEALLNAAAAGL